jgi:hypothetical protein
MVPPIDADAPGALTVSTSWDDGHPLDLRLADLLHKHGARGTFYTPNANSEGRAVMNAAQLRQLSRGFEIGGHTRDHIVLQRLPECAAYQQIVSNKQYLEDTSGAQVTGFAYVRGRYDRRLRKLVRRAGYKYARTIRCFTSTPGSRAYDLPTTVQLFPHASATYLKNFVAGGPTPFRARVLRCMLGSRPLADRCFEAATLCAAYGGHFHLWGHSWELEEHNLWRDLDALLTRLADLHPVFVDNAACGRLAARTIFERPRINSRIVGDGREFT